MKRLWWASSLFAAALAGCWSSDSKFVQSCEELLKETLRSPSTYRRVGVVERREPIPLEDYLAAQKDSEAVKRLYRQQGTQPVRILAAIEYDAANAYGTPVRGAAVCHYDSTDGDASRIPTDLVRINGKTRTDMLVDRARQLVR
jgi:hypothetical protein